MVNAGTIKALQDIMRKDVGIDGDAQRIAQLVWILFLKVFDDREREWELLDRRYVSPIPDEYRWRTWAANPEGMTGETLLTFVDGSLFPTLKTLVSSEDERSNVIRSVFEDAYNYMKSGTLLRQVVNKVERDLDLNRAEDRHVFGDLYEQLLQDLQSAGNAGEYYTPRPVTNFMVEMVGPRLRDRVLDPACGTGGFLTSALELVRRNDVHSSEDEDVAAASVHGYEKKPLPHLLCTTNMMLHGVDVPTNIVHGNALARPLRDYGPADRVEVIVTNPPFRGMEEDGIENNFPAAIRTRETADLFLALVMHLLKPAGRAAIVLPDSSLFGSGVKENLRRRLTKDCNLHTIVRLPRGVFAPYTDIRTNLLFFDKGPSTQTIWFYELLCPHGDKYTKLKSILGAHLDPIRAWWEARIDTGGRLVSRHQGCRSR